MRSTGSQLPITFQYCDAAKRNPDLREWAGPAGWPECFASTVRAKILNSEQTRSGDIAVENFYRVIALNHPGMSAETYMAQYSAREIEEEMVITVRRVFFNYTPGDRLLELIRRRVSGQWEDPKPDFEGIAIEVNRALVQQGIDGEITPRELERIIQQEAFGVESWFFTLYHNRQTLTRLIIDVYYPYLDESVGLDDYINETNYQDRLTSAQIETALEISNALGFYQQGIPPVGGGGSIWMDLLTPMMRWEYKRNFTDPTMEDLLLRFMPSADPTEGVLAVIAAWEAGDRNPQMVLSRSLHQGHIHTAGCAVLVFGA